MLRRVKLQVIWLVRDRQRGTCCTAQNTGHKQTVSLLQSLCWFLVQFTACQMSSENIGLRETKPLSTACRRHRQHWNPDGTAYVHDSCSILPSQSHSTPQKQITQTNWSPLGSKTLKQTPFPGIPCRSLIHSQLCDRLCSLLILSFF